jgi:hypothetical protein
MMLSLSTAHHLFWLGRYMSRNETVMSILPLVDDDVAVAFARAFSLKARSADALNAQLAHPDMAGSVPANFAQIQDNVQYVRGVLHRTTFEAFNQLWRLRDDPLFHAVERLQHAKRSMQDESADVCLYWQLGECVEHIDAAMRQGRDAHVAIGRLQDVAARLPQPSWLPIIAICHELQTQPDFGTFYFLCDRLHELFEEGP